MYHARNINSRLKIHPTLFEVFFAGLRLFYQRNPAHPKTEILLNNALANPKKLQTFQILFNPTKSKRELPLYSQQKRHQNCNEKNFVVDFKFADGKFKVQPSVNSPR